jgi:hypothetical protein
VSLDLEAIKTRFREERYAITSGALRDHKQGQADVAALIAEVERLRGLLEQTALWLPEGDPLAGPLDERIREALGESDGRHCRD